MDEKEEQLRSDPSFARYFDIWQTNESSFVFVPLAEIYRKKGLLEEAADVCRRGLRHNADSISGRFLLARICVDQQRIQEAKSILSDILKHIPDHDGARSLLQSLQEDPDVDSVPAETKSSPSPTPSIVVNHEETPGKKLWETVTMAEIYIHQKEWRAAEDICRAILTREPGHSRARELLDFCQEKSQFEGWHP
ncbi:MAG: hypothetical protein A3I75_01575 [Deltaproteobacteria bacterium RIFCSPLOWO2_02_FULL_50_16]|nr:MAG: hypothetical protein A3B79_03585 [Deltaproteobacteria bacterium RIFCSPHIGHO2_02_FULL_50_15]OGQ56107.1 MAG: hypothetical protein A3I75_01575 [Deltaproteobacteria bacterium RIFCSPLOWO2_02_FULL_50_16]OGQ68432.1 MAG: hypothetical protein A3F89_00490 [Deltaproteobacteria bacterium RIFCSPLOWO2_12_FULL_50_11]